MPRTMTVGTASVNWGFDPLYTWTPKPPLDDMLDEMAQAGYAGTEISYNFPSDVAALQRALGERDLQAAGTFHALDVRNRSNHQRALEAIVPVADRLQALGSNTIILSDMPSPARLALAGRVAQDGSDGLTTSQWRTMCDGFNRVGELLAGRGMLAVFHPHVGTYVETRSEIDRLCELTDPALLGLCPDTGHLMYAGVVPQPVFADYASRIGYVHLKDVDRAKLDTVRAGAIDFVSAVRMGLFVELGAGVVPVRQIISSLAGAGYGGWLIVEQDAPPDPLGAAQRNRAYLREEFGL